MGVALAPSSPPLALAIGVVSHFALDAIPHWDYDLKSLKGEKWRTARENWADFVKLAADVFIGVAVAAGFLWAVAATRGLTGTGVMGLMWPAAAGAFGGVLPDLLQVVWYKWQPRWLAPVQKFHNLTHYSDILQKRPLVGALCQVVIVGVVVGVCYWVVAGE